MLRFALDIIGLPTLNIIICESIKIPLSIHRYLLKKLSVVCKHHYLELQPILHHRRAMKRIERGLVVEDDDESFGWWFPDIPWQVFSCISRTKNTLWGYDSKWHIPTWLRWNYYHLEEPEKIKHICLYQPAEWIYNNWESEAYSKHPEVKRDKTLIANSREEIWRLRCMGKKERLVIIDDEYSGFINNNDPKPYDLIRFNQPYHYNKKLITRHPNNVSKKNYEIIFEADIPIYIREKRIQYYKRQVKKKILYSLGSESHRYFLERDIIEIHCSIEPLELASLCGIKSLAKQIIYRRIGEVPSEILKLLYQTWAPELKCLKGDFVPDMTVSEIFEKEWHKNIPNNSGLYTITDEFTFINFVMDYDEKWTTHQALKILNNGHIYPCYGWGDW